MSIKDLRNNFKNHFALKKLYKKWVIEKMYSSTVDNSNTEYKISNKLSKITDL